MDCIFCKIAAKEIPSHMFYEDAHAFGILDIQPLSPGHTMVIPKMHAATLLDLPEQEIGPLFAAVKAVTARLEAALKPDGFTMGINHGEISSQSVKHLHVHVIPRWQGDGGGSLHSVVDRPGSEPVAEIARKLVGP